MIPEHMGALHPYEHVLVLLLAFGPFVLLAVVVAVVRRRDRAQQHDLTGSDRDEHDQPR